MGRYLMGLLSGAALIGLAFSVLDTESDVVVDQMQATSSPPTLSDQPNELDAEVDDQSAGEPNLPIGVQEPAVSNNYGGQVQGLTEDERRNLAADELDAMIETATGTSQLGRLLSEKIRRENVENWSNEPLPMQPIWLPPEFWWLSTSEWPNPDHERLQREPRDPVWSATTEAHIATFLSNNPEITQKYGFPTVNCRTTACELAFVAYGVDENAYQIMMDGKFKAVAQESWSGQFQDSWNNVFPAFTDGNVTTFLWHLEKDE